MRIYTLGAHGALRLGWRLAQTAKDILGVLQTDLFQMVVGCLRLSHWQYRIGGEDGTGGGYAIPYC